MDSIFIMASVICRYETKLARWRVPVDQRVTLDIVND